MSHAQAMFNPEPPAPAAKGTVGAVGSQTSYNPGLSYLVGPALYELMKIWSDISVLYQKLVTTVTTSETNKAQASATFEVDQGKDMKSQAFAQGIANMVGGGLTLGIGFSGSFSSDQELENLGEEKEGLEKYQKTLSDVMEEGSAGGLSEDDPMRLPVKAQMEELMDQTEFRGRTPSTSDQMMLDEKGVARMSDKATMQSADARDQAKLKEEYKTKLRDNERNMQERRSAISNKNNTRMQVGQAVGQITGGAGTTASGQYQLEQKESEAKETVTKNAQTVLQGIDSHFRSQVEKMVEAALQIITTLASISHANKANS